jgi:phage gpG-like protein
MNIGISDIELKNLIQDIDQYSEEVKTRMIKELRVTGLMIESDYKIAVPVDTGRLRSSVHTKHSDYKRHSYKDATGQRYDGELSIEPKDNQVVVGTNVVYAAKIEFEGGKVKGQNALATAFEKNTRGLMDRLKKLI